MSLSDSPPMVLWRHLSATVLGAALLAATLWTLPAGRAALAASRQGARAELRSLRERIAEMARAGDHDATERAELTAQLRAAELSLSGARSQLVDLEHQLAQQTAQRAVLASDRARQAQQLQTDREALAGQLRAAYLLRRGGTLELLLEQRDPLASERLMRYVGYLSRAQAAQLASLQIALQRLDALDAALAQQQSSLQQLHEQQQAQLAQLSAAREQRQRVLVGLTLRARSRTQQLAQLQSQQAALERLLERLDRAPPPAVSVPAPGAGEPPDLNSPFGRLRGQLAWPVSGRLVAQFGQLRPSGVPWDGLLIATGRDAPVHAVSGGRVVYADWLPGLGLLEIIDHGNGYLSLYGHNDRLYKSVGAAVRPGEIIAAAGDTGGRPDTQLYFEIRRAGRPVDPLPWFRTRHPNP